MKEDKYTKFLAKGKVGVIFDMRDIRGNVLQSFVWRRQHGAWKLTETSVTESCSESMNSSLEELINIKIMLFLIQGLSRKQNPPK